MNATLILLKILVAATLLAGAPLALKRRWRLFLAVPLAVFQGFVPWSNIAGTPIPIAFWGGLLLWPELISEFRLVATWKPTACIIGIILLYSISLLWSPDRKLGLAPIGYFLEFLVIFSAVVTEGRRDEKSLFRLLFITVTLGIAQAITVVLFRVMPGLKFAFYLSSVAKWFISPNSLQHMFMSGQNNVLSPGKSGGMVGVDANFSATYLGILTFMAIGLALRYRSRWPALIGILLLAAVPFVGSKAGLILAAALPIFALQAISWQYRRWRNVSRVVMVAIIVAGTFAWFGPKAFEANKIGQYKALDSLLDRSEVTLSTREKIWEFAPRVFAQHPVLGQGFGGWQKAFIPYARQEGLPNDLPPHNTIIYLWSQGGLLAALLGLSFMQQVLKLGWREMHSGELPTFAFGFAMTFGFLWTFIQGMGENFGLIGDIHMSPLLACLLALGYLHRRPSRLAVGEPQLIGQSEYPHEAAA